MTEEELGIFHDSLSRCSGVPQFIERFYDSFMASSEEVREKFRNTDFRKQRRMLKASLYAMLLAAGGQPEGRVHLERIAARHSKRELDIPPHLYDLWIECLVRVVKECDPYCTAETERVWRKMMGRGIAFMRARYDAT